MDEQSSASALLPGQPDGPAARRGRRPPDVGALLEQADAEAGQLDSTAARRVRRAPNLGALLEQVDAEAAQRAAAQQPDLTGLLDRATESGVTQRAEQPLVGEDSEQVETGGLKIPPELETYLSPEMWRRLNGPDPGRGVMVNALERVRSVLYLLSTFLPRGLVQEKMRQPHAGRVRGQAARGSLLFSDVSGFTALSEKLAVYGSEGAERLTTAMNEYFSAMLDILAEGDGTLFKFAGDAMLVYFEEEENGEQAHRALRVGRRMLGAMSRFGRIKTPAGTVSLQMKIGLATGEFLAASVGDTRRMEYIVLGRAVGQTMAAEGMNTGGGQLLLDQATAAIVGRDGMTSRGEGFYLLRDAAQAETGGYEIHAEARRARGAIPWTASPQSILGQIEVALRQIQAISPYLAAELVERLVAPSARRQFTSQFRPTTVLFCNFTGPEALLEAWGQAGVQRVTSLLDAYFKAMNGVVARYGGIISRIDPYSKGSKMLILFGAPVAHEDDTQRAVSAALAMNAELDLLENDWRKRYARHLPAGWDAPLIQHRIGVTVGQTYAGQVGSSTRREYTVMGDEVNLAARLMSNAEMGRILVSQQVYAVTQDFFLITPRQEIRVKGKREPVPIYQVEGPLDDTLARRAHSRGALVGRQAEMAQARAILQASLQGVGSILTLQGPAGVGKSHLADRLLNQAAELGAQVFFNQCRSFNAEAPFAAWKQWIRSLAGITSLDDNPQICLAKFRRLMEDLQMEGQPVFSLGALIGLRRADLQPEVSPAEPATTDHVDSDLRDLALGKLPRRRGAARGSVFDVLQQLEQGAAAGASPDLETVDAYLSPGQRKLLNETIRALLERLARRAPRVIFFEDAQWMDRSSLDVLRFLEPHLATMPVLFVLALRSESDQAENSRKAELLDLAAGRAADRPASTPGTALELSPFEQEGTLALVSHLLVEELAEVIHAQSLGNPLMVSEITHWFKRSHQISASELQEVLQTSDFLQKLVLSRLEGMPEGQREVARRAAVIGQEFRVSEIQALLPTEIDAVTLSHHLSALKNEQIIHLSEQSVDSRYAFRQALVRDILYNSLPHEKRRELHHKFANHLSSPVSARRRLQTRMAALWETASQVTPLQEAETVAYHYEQAEQWLAAAQYRLKAGEQSRKAGRYDKAASNDQSALQNLNNVPLIEEATEAQVADLKIQAFTGQGDAALLSGDYLHAIPAYEAALASTATTGGEAVQAGLVYRLALALPMQGKAAEALERLRTIAPEPGTTHDPAVAAVVAWLLWRSGDRAAQQWVERGHELIGTMENPWESRLRALLIDLEGKLNEAIFEYHQHRLLDGTALATIRVGDAYLAQQDLDAALDLYTRAGTIWSNTRTQHNALSLAHFYQAKVHWLKHDEHAARQALESAQASLEHCPPSLQANGRTAVRKAIQALSQGKMRRWPVLDWQSYDDEFRISILFRDFTGESHE
jgi:class 3 adenylate cyclase